MESMFGFDLTVGCWHLTIGLNYFLGTARRRIPYCPLTTDIPSDMGKASPNRQTRDKSRGDTKPCEPLIRCLKILHEALNVSSLSAMVSRLEIMAKQRGMGSHLSPTETTCYLTADMFYLEVLLLPGGEVEDVKLAQHGEAPVSSESLLQLLKSKKFEEFSVKLKGLSSLYNIPGDNETKIKVYTALQFLGKDLQKISHLPRALRECNLQVDMILNGRIGYLTAGSEGIPMTIQYYISPSDILLEMSDSVAERGSVGQLALVTVGPTDSTHKLQMASVIPQPPQLDAQGLPLFSPLCEVLSEMMPACFQLKLQPPLPMLSSFVEKLSQITDVAIADADLQWAPFPQLMMTLLGENGGNKTWDGQDAHFLVPLPGKEIHSYVLPGAAWEEAALMGTLMSTIPFTHPAHVPALLELLRHQCVINTLLASCITSLRPSPGPVCDLYCEVLPESGSSLSVTFHLSDSDSLSVLLVNVADSRKLTCSLFAVGSESMDEYVSRVLKRCMSIPVTMRALNRRLSKRTCGEPLPACSTTISTADVSPASPLPMSCEADGSLSSGSGLESIGIPTTSSTAAVFSQDAMGPDTTATAAESAFCLSVAEVNTNPTANPYPCASVCVYSHWMHNNHLPELI
ncbi:mediator of RNA polymerase II transcription subunit 1-like isoform X3 [Oncorhynchus nerka]|uniref:mediator of RNA polymerase II transcription subunit 1-like isoform X3 n=1 Tax=Oncorhynchus nerka TaxID=8023 RepID=UPI0011329A6C|nr:mediator of RNA polymerase II transcription subunit 1-like isoform X1 [Oncorhynchus nerka]